MTVLVVGAGPAGLTVAHELARRGVPVRVIDRAAGPAVHSRALATHARTLEIYHQMGVLDEILARGQRVEHFTLHQGGRERIRFDTDYSGLPTRFPFTLMIDQALTEGVLRQRLGELGVNVEWSTELVDFHQHDDVVSVTLRHAGGAVEHCVQDWLVGADGGHSTVRKRLGLRLLGESTQTWLIADAVVETDLPRDSIHWMHTGDGTIMLVPFPDPGKWRLLDTVDVDHDGDPEQVAARFRTKISRALGTPTVVRTPTWVSVFTIQQRMIERMRVGRCFVAGDAAHVHSPASGQGMNTGVQDAYNLGWKLAEVARGEAEERLLDSYGVERVPVGRVLLGSTKKATALVALKNAAAGVVLPVALGLLRRLTPVKRRIERKIMKGMSGLALSYPDSPISLGAGERVEALVPGDRPEIEAELRSPRWTLLAFGPCGFRGDAVVSVCEIDGPEAGTWLLARPDGYLAARGQLGRPQDIRAALDAVGLRAHDQSGLKSGAATSG